LPKALKTADIDGEFPSMDSKNMKMRGFARDKRKSSAYLTRNELDFKNKRKTSAYGGYVPIKYL
jgi:hypothetical protein